jgi:hypothetical protein
MGHGGERHDIQSQETQAGRWVSFRQPVLRAARERLGETFRFTHEANPGEVWEEDEFWIELSWRIDPDGALGIRRWFESPYRPGEEADVHEYYRWIFENAVPGLPAAAGRGRAQPAGIHEPPRRLPHRERDLRAAGDARDPRRPAPSPIPWGTVSAGGKPVGLALEGGVVAGWPTPSRRLEIYSRTLEDWGLG